MKRRAILISCLAALLAAILLLCVFCGRDQKDVTRQLRDLGIPLITRYTDESPTYVRARCSWDMIAYGGDIYIGCGDYDTNMGPVTVWSYDPDGAGWHESSVSLDDEHIKRYEVLDGKLCILGTDPRGDWSMGSYYLLENGAWQEHRVLPSGIHCFDAVEYGGKTFFGLGVNSGDSPVVVSENGADFSPVAFVREGVPVNTSAAPIVRVYNFTLYGDALYAFLTMGTEDEISYDVYRYDGKQFCYFSTPSEVFLRSYDIAYTGEFAGLAIFVNGYCYYVSEDMTDFRPWRVELSDLACDVTVIGDTLYALAYTVLDEGYESAVYASRDGRKFTKLFYFVDEIPANQFVYSDGVFYFSMGRYYDGDSVEMGRVYALTYDIASE